jgi:tRNA(fMet)-specific endonuclease VapC
VREDELILLDIDVIIEFLDKKSDRGKVLMLRIMESWEVYCTSSVNVHEVLFGIEKYPKSSHLVLQIPTL